MDKWYHNQRSRCDFSACSYNRGRYSKAFLLIRAAYLARILAEHQRTKCNLSERYVCCFYQFCRVHITRFPLRKICGHHVTVFCRLLAEPDPIRIPNEHYTNFGTAGISKPSVLDHDDGAIVAISLSNSSTLVYYHSHNSGGIREVYIRGTSSRSSSRTEGISSNFTAVANTTAVMSTNSSIIKQPIGAVTGTTPSSPQEVQVYFVAPGDELANSTIQAVIRPAANNSSWLSSARSAALPLANRYGGETLGNMTSN